MCGGHLWGWQAGEFFLLSKLGQVKVRCTIWSSVRVSCHCSCSSIAAQVVGRDELLVFGRWGLCGLANVQYMLMLVVGH